MIFVGRPLNPKGGGLGPPRPPWPPRPLEPSKYFGLPMMNPRRPPLPPNKPYHWPLNYLEYVKDIDLDAHVKVFKLPLEQMVK